jgi:hypothetical protein
MSTTATITITARDQASQAFQAIGKSAGGMSSSVQQSAKGFGVLKGAMAGLASSAVIGFLGDAARAAAESEVSMARLQQAVENTGASFAELEPALNAAAAAATDMAFDDEDAADALATLTAFTGDANEALDLLQVTMDIARGRGVDLATAATAVGKAAEGNVGALTRMGVAVEEGATASEALAAAQATFAGQAEAYASTSAGAADRIAIAWGNLKEEIGGLAGPLTGIISLLPGLSAGFSAVGSALGALKGAGGFSGLLASINPVVLAMTGGAAAVGLLTAAFIKQREAIAEVSASFDTYESAIADVIDPGLSGLLEGLTLTRDEIDNAISSNSSFIDALRGTGDVFIDTNEATVNWNSALAQTIDRVQASGGELGTLALTAAELRSQFIESGRGIEEATAALNDYATVIGHTGPGQDQAAATLKALTSAFLTGKISTEQYGAALDAVANKLPYFDAQANKLAQTTQSLAIDTYRYNSALRDNATYSADAATAAQELADWEQQRAAILQSVDNDRYNSQLRDSATYSADAARAAEEHAAALEQQRIDAEALAATFSSALIPAIQGVAGGFSALIVPGEDILDVLSRLGDTAPNVANGFADLVDNLNDSAGALDGVLGAFNQIDQLGNRSQNAEDIATGLVGDPGVYATVDDLLARGLITREQYNQLQADEVRISQANASVQEDLNLIRTGQIDDLADATVNYAAYIDQLSRASDEEQLHALYLMDSANQAKVAAAYSTAYAATLGEIPKDVATDIIANGAMADPVLAGILEDYGLIEQGADGTITVTFPDASEEAVNRFEAMFGDGNVAMTANGLVVVTDDAGNQMVYDQFGNLVDKTVKATIEVTLSHSSGLDSDTIGGILAGRGISAEDAGVTSTSVAVIIESDITEFEKGLEEAAGLGEEFTENPYTAQLAADAEPWNDTLETAAGEGKTWEETTFTSDLDGEPQPWNDVLAAAMTDGGTWENEVYITNLDGNRDMFDAVVDSIPETVGTRYIEIDGIDSNGDLSDTSGGRQLGGTVRSQDVSSVAKVYQTAANGRTVLVGEAGPELAFLPYGTQVMPSTPSRSRMAADGGNGMRFYGPVHIHAASPDIAREIERQMTTRAMR